MRLIRIALTDFRGVASSEVSFASPGVTVVVGPNEVGKSSLAEALRLIRDYKDSSKHRDVMVVRPTHRDAGPQVEIEVETGPYRFVYTKRWAKKPFTELSISAPKSEQLSGDDAHERVDRIFAETLDPELWGALQQVQGESLQQAHLARVGPLQSALSASTDAASDDTHGDLMTQIDKIYADFFTKSSGVPRGSYAKAHEEDAELESRVEALRARLREVDGVVERHARLVADRERLLDRVETSKQECADLEKRYDAVVELRRDHERATGLLREAALAETAALTAHDVRAAMITDGDRLRALAAAALVTAQATDHDHEGAAAALSAFDDKHGATGEQLAAARTDLDAARAALTRAHHLRDLEALRARLADIAKASALLEAAEVRLVSSSLDDAALRELTDLYTEARTAEAAAAAGAAHVTVERLGKAAISLGGDLVETSCRIEVTDATTVEVAGVVRVVITPDEASGRRSGAAGEARRAFSSLLEAHGIADLAAARAAADARADVVRSRDAASLARDVALAGDTAEVLRARLAALDTTDGGEPATGSVPQLEESLDDAERLLRDVLGASQATELARSDLAARLAEAHLVSIRSRDRLEAAESESERFDARLAREREATDDSGLHTVLAAARTTGGARRRAVEESQRELDGVDAGVSEMLLDNARESADKAVLALAENERHRAGAESVLEMHGRDGLHDQLGVALAVRQDAARRLDALHARGEAVRLLRLTMTTRQHQAQQRYVGPFRDAIEALGRVVFGPGFAVDIDDDLSIASRTLGGVTVPFESLSGGAREQLSVIGRLAAAQLVSADDGSPVLLDDSLGFSDRDRRRMLGAIINMVGKSAQIIILTCEPDRFTDIGSAQIVELGA